MQPKSSLADLVASAASPAVAHVLPTLNTFRRIPQPRGQHRWDSGATRRPRMRSSTSSLSSKPTILFLKVSSRLAQKVPTRLCRLAAARTCSSANVPIQSTEWVEAGVRIKKLMERKKLAACLPQNKAPRRAQRKELQLSQVRPRNRN